MKDKWIRAGALLCAAMLLLSGCGGAGKGAEENGETGLAAPGSEAMGRYMETFYEFPEEVNRNGGVNWLDDGSLTVISFGEGLYRSKDGGQTWQQEETAWFPLLEGVYCLAAVMGPDGTVAASCSGEMPDVVREAYGKEVPEDWEGNYCVFALPDETVKVVDFGFSQEDGTCIESFVFKEDGRLFAGDFRGRICQVDVEKESVRELFTAERAVGYMDFSGETLMAVGYDRLYLYDLQKETLRPQDHTVDAYIAQTLKDGTVSYTGGGFPLAVAGSPEEDEVYLAGRDGVYRHVLGGSVMEQVIDGALSALGDSYAFIYRLKVLAGQEFQIAFSPSVGFVQYHFDETIPSMPDREIRVYSLEENDSLRKAVTDYKRAHTDVYVRYEVGIKGDDAMTKEDAVKRLNTQVLSGEGPDVLLLDGLPMNTYIEKGMLRDLRPVLEEIQSETELFSNLAEGAADEDGAVYVMPMCVRVPLLAGRRDVIEEMDDLRSIASGMEALRKEYPEGGVFGITDPESLLRLFGMVSASEWTGEEGQIKEASVTEFLELVKQIYDAEKMGTISEQAEQLEEEAEETISYGGDPIADRMQVCSNVLQIPRGYALAAGGYVESIQLCLDNVTSVLRTDEQLDYRVMGGQVTDAFLPVAMVGISSKSTQPGAAEEFVRMMFAPETQEQIYEGFPVNKEAYEAHFDVSEENDENGSMTLSMDGGGEQELSLYWPNKEERDRFTSYVESLKHPVLSDDYLCGLVYEEGIKVLEGERSAEEGAAEIVKKASIYLAE